ncbi:conserved exported hypothetical protein [Flavobacterium sp. 9AF]|uniref:hypothetical protein n=1 Tax=Flavobacterium sp. 9AF TaxID=2653142 RepID=UPI0012F32549|nr:hypothetical protein [Flavobacterium sp. 9AF]VXC18854.1 conserved exported hypothetical protein [Flavobacterium sp. 9AF]
MKKTIYILFAFFLLSCTNDSYSDLIETDTSINLKWNKAYSEDSIDKSLIGLKWALSYLGAVLPTSNSGFIVNNNTIIMDLKKIGFNDNALKKILILSEKIKNTYEYKNNNAVDLGRYVTLLLGSSEHYYEILDVPNNLNEILNQYNLLPEKGYVNNSGVSLEHRIIQFSEQNGFNQLFFCQEINPITGVVYEYETIELLTNGQLRFGIFDQNGIRKNSVDAEHSNAGKPAKCMWCHESNIQQMYTPQADFNGYLAYNEFQSRLISYRESNRVMKLGLNDGVDFSQTQQHTYTELLYISFMEPSAERLSIEWNLPLSQVQNLLSNFSTHVYPEFPFLGELYDRNDIESVAPFQGLPVSTSVRETSLVEVNHLQ